LLNKKTHSNLQCNYYTNNSVILSPIISKTNLNTLQIIQINALRIIFKKPLMSIHERANLIRIEIKMINLRKRYIFKALENNNPMISDVTITIMIDHGHDDRDHRLDLGR